MGIKLQPKFYCHSCEKYRPSKNFMFVVPATSGRNSFDVSFEEFLQVRKRKRVTPRAVCNRCTDAHKSLYETCPKMPRTRDGKGPKKGKRYPDKEYPKLHKKWAGMMYRASYQGAPEVAKIWHNYYNFEEYCRKLGYKEGDSVCQEDREMGYVPGNIFFGTRYMSLHGNRSRRPAKKRVDSLLKIGLAKSLYNERERGDSYRAMSRRHNISGYWVRKILQNEENKRASGTSSAV